MSQDLNTPCPTPVTMAHSRIFSERSNKIGTVVPVEEKTLSRESVPGTRYLVPSLLVQSTGIESSNCVGADGKRKQLEVGSWNRQYWRGRPRSGSKFYESLVQKVFFFFFFNKQCSISSCENSTMILRNRKQGVATKVPVMW